MLGHYFTVAVRNLLKYKTQNLICILGLAVGILCFSVCLYCTRFVHSTNSCFPNHGRIVELFMKRSDVTFSGTSALVAEQLRQLEIPQTDHITCIPFVREVPYNVHVSDEEMEKRMHFSNPEMISDFVAQGKSVVILLGHYGNWEWIPSIYRNYDNLVGGELYRPLKNRYFDSFFLKLRGRFGTLNIPKNDALRTIVKLRREGKLFALGFIADQTPSGNNLHYWAEFLNQDTPFLNGPERIAKSADCAVVSFDVKVEKRGYYSCDLICVSENAKSEPENRITDRFVELFETTIRRAPAYWLWSHRRWKHKRVHTS